MSEIMEEWLSRAEAAALLGLTGDALNRLERAGKGPEFVRISERKIKYRPEAIARFLQSRTVTASEVA
jgi:hypothetical protein